MRRSLRLALALALPALAAAQSPSRPSLAEPSLSPDGREIAFSSGGDIWSVAAEGGDARLLVADPAMDSRPLFSPDGRRVAFVSQRTGNGDIYVLDLPTGAVRRVTFDDAAEQLDAWSRDGRWLYVSGSSRDVAGMNDVYRVSPEGGTPMPVAADRYASEYWAAPSPDGRALAITARGIVSGQWWRRGRSHIDESEIWVVSSLDRASGAGQGSPAASAPAYAPVTTGGAKSAWASWAPDGRTLYFMSDRDGAENLWAQPMDGLRPNGAARRLTAFRDGRVLWPHAGADGRAIVFERDFGVWRYDVATGEAREVPVALRGAPAAAAVERVAPAAGAQELALSPDGRKVAFVVRGEVFAAAARPEPNAPADAAFRVTTSPAVEGQLAWSPDSRRLAYVSGRDGRWRVFLYDFGTREERALVDGVSPRWSPDGRELAFTRGGRELRVVEVASGRERLLTAGTFEQPPFAGTSDVRWSPDGRWIAFAQPAGPRSFTNLFVVETRGGGGGGAARQVSFVGNAFGGDVVWGADGTSLLFVTGQRTEPSQVARVDLVPRTPRFREDAFRDLFTTPTQDRARDTANVERRAQRAERAVVDSARDTTRAGVRAAGTAGAPRTRIVFDDIRTRLSFLPIGMDVAAIAPSPDGRQLALVAEVAGQRNVYLYPLDELATDAVARQVTSTPAFKSDVQWSPDGRELYYREGGRLTAVTVESRQTRTIAAAAEMDVDFAREKHELFAQAWGYLRDQFYDETYHGADWDAVRARWAPQVAGARTAPELRRVLNLMVGELNASHLGVNPPGPAQPPNTGRLGVRFDRLASERDGVPRVAEVLPLGPAAIAGVRVGDAIASVDGRPVTRATNLDELLAYRVGRRVTLGLAGADGARREVAVRPVNLGTEKGLAYRAWVESRRAYVDRASGGTLGYVHMADMSAESLNQLHIDLDAENQARKGVVVDVRNNNGGFVNAYALDVFGRRPYLTMQVRGMGAAPARTQLGQRALELPTVLVTNQHSLSDAEDFSEGWRTLGLGPIVGEPTAGWIVYTWNMPLMDGTVLRLPRQKITDAKGENMERRPRPVDVEVERPMGEWYTGKDVQLDAAVAELQKRLR